MKLIPIVIRYFEITEGVNVKIFNFTSIPSETSTILFDEVHHNFCVFNLMNKVSCFCADNTNTNFGGLARRGENNIFSS